MSHAAITQELDALARLATQPEQLHDMLSQTLRALRGVVAYDLAAMYGLDGDVLHVRAAEGPLATSAVREHTLELSRFPSIRRALATRRPIPLEEHDHAGEEGDPYDGILDLPPGHSCMVVPVHAGGRDLGIITLDRQVCAVYKDHDVLLAGLFGQLLGTALLYAEQAALLDRYRHRLREHNRLLEAELGGATDEAVRKLESSQSPAMRRLLRLARAAASSDVPVLLSGETGSGKEVVARAIHAWSPRAGGPFVKLNCAAIPPELVESELFGHVRGAFSGADRDRDGRFLTADGGTLLLDEIGDMPLPQQAKLLRVLQEGTFEPVGSDRPLTVDVRVLAASHVDLEQAVQAGRFREDLYYRLAVFPIQVPALRERSADIVPTALGWLSDHARRTGRGPWTLTQAARQRLDQHDWPGNVRELINVLERATILCPQGPIDADDLGRLRTSGRRPTRATRVEPDDALPSFVDNERAYLRRLLEQTDGQVYGDEGAATLAGLKPTTLYSKLKKHGLK